MDGQSTIFYNPNNLDYTFIYTYPTIHLQYLIPITKHHLIYIYINSIFEHHSEHNNFTKVLSNSFWITVSDTSPMPWQNFLIFQHSTSSPPFRHIPFQQFSTKPSAINFNHLISACFHVKHKSSLLLPHQPTKLPNQEALVPIKLYNLPKNLGNFN